MEWYWYFIGGWTALIIIVLFIWSKKGVWFDCDYCYVCCKKFKRKETYAIERPSGYKYHITCLGQNYRIPYSESLSERAN